MKVLPVLSRAFLAIVFAIALMGSSLLSGSAFAQACPDNPENIVSISDCTPCHTDLDNDGKVTVSDLLVLKHCISQTGGCQNPAYDVNGDGVVNDVDAAVLRACFTKAQIKKN